MSVLSVPFGLPRRYIFVFIAASLGLTVFILTHPTSREYAHERIYELDSKARDAGFHPANWLPAGLVSKSPFGLGARPPEFDELGRCLFLSPFDALSAEEKARAEQVQLEEIFSGIVRAKQAVFQPPSERKATKLSVSGNDTDALEKMIEQDSTIGTGQETLTNPILGLLRDGERKWKDMLARASTTLEQAVEEYKIRYGRNPPKGFDEWWEFAWDRSVLLPDEYDSINNALLPYWAFSPDELNKRNEEAEKVVETFTLILRKGKVVLEWNDDYSRDQWWASRPRADAQINLMEPFLSKLPDFRATFTIHDQPSFLPSYDRMKDLHENAKAKTHTKNVKEEDQHEFRWRDACPPDSLVRRDVPEPASEDTFVSSHLAAMDPCQHPSLLENHGITIEVKNAQSQPKPHTRILPIFVPSKTVLHADIPITPVGKDGRRDDVGIDPAWSSKSNKLYWRGLATGLQHNKGTGQRWRQSHRERLHSLANNMTSGKLEVLVPVGRTGRAEVQEYTAKELSRYYMDVKMSGGPWQCDWGDGSCDEMKNEFEFGSKDGPERSNAFKYVFDTDGNAWSSRFPRLMASRNMVIKSSIFPEWNTHTLPEWYAYVPSKMDYSDLYSIMAFFRGPPKGIGGHDEVARRIASNGQCWVEKTWRREDMQAYMFRLYLEWARLLNPERDSGAADYVPSARDSATGAEAAVPEIEA